MSYSGRRRSEGANQQRLGRSREVRPVRYRKQALLSLPLQLTCR